MAKGQKRSSRETRKPKKEKASLKSESTFASQVKAAANPVLPRGGKAKG